MIPNCDRCGHSGNSHKKKNNLSTSFFCTEKDCTCNEYWVESSGKEPTYEYEGLPITYAEILDKVVSGKWSVNTARYVMGFTRYVDQDIVTPENKRADILKVAESLINGNRAQVYGPPEISFGRIADLLNAMGFRIEVPSVVDYGRTTYRTLDSVDAALALTQLKVSRIISSPNHEDSWVDAAGYIALGAEMALREQKPQKTIDDIVDVSLHLPNDEEK